MSVYPKLTRSLTLGTISAWGVAMTAVAPVFANTGINLGFDEGALPEGWFDSSQGLINSLINIAFVIAVLLVFFYLIMGGIDWITSGGEKSKTEGARNKITAAIIGLIVLAASYAILQLALGFLGTSAGGVLGGGAGSGAGAASTRVTGGGAGATGGASGGTSGTARYSSASIDAARAGCPRATTSDLCGRLYLLESDNVTRTSTRACTWNRSSTPPCQPRFP